MKGINGNPALDAYQRVAVNPVNAARPVAKTEVVGDATPSAGDQAAKVTISSTARELASAAGGKDAARISELKQQVEQGSFQVNPELIARRMLDATG
jgi:negative regulator of flagellin synthesis FlgM